MRATRFAVTGHPFFKPLLDPALGVLDVPALGGASNDAFVGHSRRYLWRIAGIEERSIFVITHHKPIFAVIEREGLGDALDCDRQSATAYPNLPLVRPLHFDSRVPENAKRLCHSANLVSPVATRDVNGCVARGKTAHGCCDSLDG